MYWLYFFIQRVFAQEDPLVNCEGLADAFGTDGVPILEPFDGSDPGGVNCIPLDRPAFGIFLSYFDHVRNWIMLTGYGVVLLYFIIGSYMVMTSGDNQTQRTEGKTKMMWSLLGLLMIQFAGFILNTLNASFYIN